MYVCTFVFERKRGRHKYAVAYMAELVQLVSNSYGSLAHIEWDSFGATIPIGPWLHYPTFLDLCLTHEWISCSNWVIAPSNLYTTYWMAVAAVSWPFACWAGFQERRRADRAAGLNISAGALIYWRNTRSEIDFFFKRQTSPLWFIAIRPLRINSSIQHTNTNLFPCASLFVISSFAAT